VKDKKKNNNKTVQSVEGLPSETEDLNKERPITLEWNAQIS
jgi:hypothetical protein